MLRGRTSLRSSLAPIVCFALLLIPAALAQPQASPPPASQSGSVSVQVEPVKGYTLSPEEAARAVAYARAHHRLYFIDIAASVIVLLLLIQLEIAPKLRDWAERTSSRRFVQAVVFGAPLLIILGILSLPTAAAGHIVERRFGQSIQGWGSWLWDWTKGQLVSLILAVILIWLFYALIRRSPRRWWFYAWLVLLPILVFLIFLEPLVFEPLFYRFTPLADSHPQLTRDLERVVNRAGERIPESHMFLMNASSKVNELNAYVTGIGASKRVVVWDTTLDRLTTPEILFVFGHEMGHYVLGHVPKGLAFAAVLVLIFLFAAFHVIRWLVRRYGARWKVRGVGDWASLPALMLVLLLFDFVSTPISNAYSRYLEHQADQYGLEVIHGIVPDASEVAAHSFQVLGEVDLDEPAPSRAVVVWFYTHPSINDRMIFARTYHPWAGGQSPEFVK